MSKIKKDKIPQTIRNKVWNTYIGKDKKQASCICCGDEDITTANWHCGHIISEKHGGEPTIQNLRPICGGCNTSMGTNNMESFMKKYGIEKPDNWYGVKKNIKSVIQENNLNFIDSDSDESYKLDEDFDEENDEDIDELEKLEDE